ncbi:probable carboxylesterase 9 [Fagus crenata]
MSSNINPYEYCKIVCNPKGSITRNLRLPTIKANHVACPGDPVLSKDFTLNAKKKTCIRVYMPTTKLTSNDGDTRIPIIFFYPRTGWIQLNWDSIFTNLHCSKLALEVPAIVVDVEYRLAPENRIPAQYEDAMDTILWVREHALDPNGEQWIRDYGDISSCYQYGCSSGGNIAFFVALKATEMELQPLRIAGNIMNQPMFGGMQRTNSELMNPMNQVLPLCALDLVWELSLPEGEDRDHWYCNPMVEGSHTSAISKIGSCLVIGFCGGPMIDRQQDFAQMLVRHGVQIDGRFDTVGLHGIEFINPKMDALFGIIKDFILRNQP